MSATDNAVVRTSDLTADSLVLGSGAIVTSSTDNVSLNDGILTVTDATLNADVSGVETGVLTGNPGHQALVNGTIKGTGSGASSLTMQGAATTGSPEKDGSISNFDHITLGDATDALTSNVIVNGDVVTTETGSIDVVHGDWITVTDEMTSGTAITVTDSTLHVGGAKDEINYAEASVLGTHALESVVPHSDMTAGTNISVDSSTLTVYDNMTAGGNISIGAGSNVTVGHADGVNNQYAFNFQINPAEVPAIVATLTAGTGVTQYILPNRNLAIEKTLTHSDMTAGNGIVIAGGSTVKVFDNMIARGDAITVNGSKLTVGTIDDLTYTAADDSSVTVYETHGDMTAKTNIVLEQSTVSIFDDQTATEGDIAIIYSNETDAFAGNVAGDNYAVVIGGTQTAGTAIAVDDSTLKVGVDQIALDGDIDIINGSTVLVEGNQSAAYGDAATAANIVVIDSQLTVTGNQTAQSNITLGNSTVNIGGNQTATEGDIAIIYSNETDAFAGNVAGDNYAVVIGGTQTAGTAITVDDSTLKVGVDQIALDGDIDIINGSTVLVEGNQSAAYGDAATAANIVVNGSQLTVTGNQTAQSDITLGNSTVNIGGNQTATEGGIGIANSNGTDAFAGNVAGEEYAVVIGGTQTAGTTIVVDNSTLKVGVDQIALDGDIGIINGSTVLVEGNQSATAATEGNSASILVNHSDLTVKGDQTAANAVMIGNNSTVRVEGDMTARGLHPNDNLTTIQINGASNVNVLGNMTGAEGGKILMTDGSLVTIDGQLTAEDGSLIISGTGTIVKIDKDNAQPFDTVIGSGIASVVVDAGNALQTGNVAVDATVLRVNGTLTATAWETASGTSLIDGTGANEGRVTVTEGDLLLGGQNGLTEATASATLGDIELAGHNVVKNSSITTEAGDIRIATDSTLAESIDNAGTLIQDSDVEAEGVISIEGETGNLALVTGDTRVLAHGSDLFDLSTGQSLETGILLSNTALSGLTGRDDVKALEGSIVLADVVSMENATLFTNSSDLVPDGNAAGTVMLDGNATLLMKANSTLESALSSADKTARIVKTGSDVLQLDYSARNYNGSIDVTSGDGSEFTVNCDGLGNDAVTRLKDTNLLVTQDAFTAAPGRVVTLGTIDTRHDEGNRNTVQGNLNRVLINGSYTRDDGKRASYQNIGTVIALNEGHSGDRAEAASLHLNGNTLVKIETVLNADGTFTHDSISLSGTLNAGGARIFGTLLRGSAHEAAVADGTRIQIVSPGGQAAVASGFHEDMLYDIAKSASGTYQRVLKTLNGHLETTPEGVYLVYSRNYLGANKNANQSQMAHVLGELSQRADHTEGTLAASSSQLDLLLDAFDYTRSEGDALRGLDSVSGVTNTIAQHAMMDATRHHLDTLRTHIGTPECPVADDGKRLQASRNSSVWFAYEGGYDSFGGDGSMGDYTRTSQGGLVGYEYTVDCNFLLGIDMGYENAIARSDATKLTADTYFADIYASVKTGIINHKLSVGAGVYDFDARRGIHVAAASHTFSETARGTTVGRSINAGYEASADFEVGRRSWVTPFLTVNFGYHTINKLKEDNLGTASLTTEFDDIAQLDAGLGARYAHQFSCVSKQAPATVFASLAVKAEFSDRRPEANSWFAADPSLGFRVHSVEREPLYVQVGAGLTVPFARNWSATAAGSGEFGNDRASVNGSIGVRYSF